MNQYGGNNSGDRSAGDRARGADLRAEAMLDAMGMLDEVDAAAFERSFRDATPAVQAELRELQAAVSADPAFLSNNEDEPPAGLKARTMARVMTAIDRQDDDFAPIAHIGRTATLAQRRRMRAAGAAGIGEAVELAGLRSDLDAFVRSSYRWRAAAIALSAALVVALVFQVSSNAFVGRVTEVVFGGATPLQMLAAIGSEDAGLRIERATYRRGVAGIPGKGPAAGLGSMTLAVSEPDRVLTCVGLGLEVRGRYTVRHVADDDTVTELGSFVANGANWAYEGQLPDGAAGRFRSGRIEVVDAAGDVVMRG
ncbi:MAG: hypothetical protein FJ260_03375 [Planctomycetes bacterium]|nr:hypothetical protein [Planctomycetota bacterium]